MTQEVKVTITAEVDVIHGKLEIEQVLKSLLLKQDMIDLIEMKVEEEAEIYKNDEHETTTDTI